MKSNHSCRRCRRWFEGEWSQATSDELRAKVQRLMAQGYCDEHLPTPCPCFYFEMDPDLTADRSARTGDDLDQVCACGHIDDEHDEQGECSAVIHEDA